MDRIDVEIELALETLRTELADAASRHTGGDFLARMLSLRVAMSRAMRRRYRALATQFDLAGQGGVCRLLEQWGDSAELHEREAECELWAADAEPLPAPLDARLWNAYFDEISVARSCEALGAAAAWESLSGAAVALGRQQLAASRFATSPRRAEDARGAELLTAIRSEAWDAEQLAELAEGAVAGRVMALRMTRWALGRCESEAAERRAPRRGARLA
ncbi:hypothetical protein [Lacipirellula parvula]|uniref:Uncharacterized protein n=1 Tax=Lacipirellula parvula TaxID=2650471 RepID=A0A5K7XAB0_9BACT|nr:hypothetical protein [Lacipirellula parvula]BBO31681.1 hypothetical protein PLANPX_1293 [Lacipirellula parvula]